MKKGTRLKKGSKTKHPRVVRGTVAQLLQQIFDLLDDMWEKLDHAGQTAVGEQRMWELVDGWKKVMETYKEAARQQAAPPQPDKWTFQGGEAFNLTAMLEGAIGVAFAQTTPDTMRLTVRHGFHTPPVSYSNLPSSLVLAELKSRFPDWPLLVD